MRQGFKPNAGVIAVVREAETATVKRMAKAGLTVPDEAAEWQKTINPWALVVGVGDAKRLSDGSLLQTAVEVGDRVMVAQVGRSVELMTAEGEVDYIYVLPFEGVMGWLTYKCEVCGFEAKASENDTVFSCPKSCVPIVAPTAHETKVIGATR